MERQYRVIRSGDPNDPKLLIFDFMGGLSTALTNNNNDLSCTQNDIINIIVF